MERRTKNSVCARKIPGLDGLRGIAIIGVMGYHLMTHTLPGGFLGVNLFFVLSGYLMAVTSLREQAQSGFHVGKFYCKRIVRIYPALILVVSATLLIAQFFAPDILRGIRSEVVSIFGANNNWWQISQNASYFTRITGTSPFTHLWSLAIEIQFYILWPALFFGYMKLKRHKGLGESLFIALIFGSVLAMLTLTQQTQDYSRVYYGTDTRIFALLIGGLLGLCQKRLQKKKRGNRHMWSVVFLLLMAGFLWLYLAADGQSAITYWGILVPSAFIASGLIDLCSDRRLPFGRWLDCLPLGWLGKRSYELYLVQYPVIFFMARKPPTGSWVWNMLMAMALILLLAQWIYQVTALLQTRKTSRFHGRKTFKICNLSFLALAATVVVGGAFVLLTSPNQSESGDQKRLQQELRENAALLAYNGVSDSPASAPVIPKEEPAVSNSSNNVDSLTFTAIGDSVMLGAVPEIQAVFPGCVIDAKEYRQVWDAMSIIRDLDAKGTLLDTVVIALGGNGSFGKDSGQKLIDALGYERTIYWIAPFGQNLTWQESTQRILNELAKENRNLTILDWPGFASGHTDWFYDDGMHLNAEGQTGYAEFMLEQLGVE